MATTFLVLTPPGAATRDENARFLRDRFSWLAFFLPVVWLLWRRAWLAAALAFAVQSLAAAVGGHPVFGPASLGLHLAVGLLVALEGPSMLLARLERKGWTLDAVISADDRDTAEEIYYDDTETAQARPETPRPGMPASTASAGRHDPMLGLVSFGEGR
ncbi:DUF2628 domain-containing protein [Shinella daejeonensis]|uniref:DUF2628 domain-containing protein n=1 Tax=Shinella daejeonensis TaxID=659017 RepID=UPI0020C77433|nr:DUF2628 domain-containing protein [Shinella daejeonensis]MCP8895799.1 DUF2628 domain-containing protein [Shinella daejeonensis]